MGFEELGSRASPGPDMWGGISNPASSLKGCMILVVVGHRELDNTAFNDGAAPIEGCS